jgi:hypothetical protein
MSRNVVMAVEVLLGLLFLFIYILHSYVLGFIYKRIDTLMCGHWLVAHFIRIVSRRIGTLYERSSSVNDAHWLSTTPSPITHADSISFLERFK